MQPGQRLPDFFQFAGSEGVSAFYFDAAGGTRHDVRTPRRCMCRCAFERHGAIHDEMQSTIRSNYQRETVTFPACIRPGNVEDFLGILEESVH